MTVTLTAADLTTEDSTTFPAGSRADRIAEAAALAVDRYAPNAPDDISDEAFVRYAYGLANATGHLSRHTIVSGEQRVRFVTDDAGLFRRCGAKAILSPYRYRRGLAPVTSDEV